jgi:DNA polymerase III subunit epsilon
LCARLSGLGSFCEQCLNIDSDCCANSGIEAYNQRVLEAVKSLKSGTKSYAIIGQGRDDAEKSVVLIDQDHYVGFGFVKGELNPQSIAEIKPLIQPYSESVTIRNILRSQLDQNSDQQIHYFA